MMTPGVRSDGAINMGSYQAYPIPANQTMQPGNGEIALAMKELKEAKDEVEKIGSEILSSGQPKFTRFGIGVLVAVLSWLTICFGTSDAFLKTDPSLLVMFLVYVIAALTYLVLVTTAIYQLLMRCWTPTDYATKLKVAEEKVATCQMRLNHLQQVQYNMNTALPSAGQAEVIGNGFSSLNTAISEKTPLLYV